jgi:hypothetical protein
MIERWVDVSTVETYVSEGYYSISNRGRVRRDRGGQGARAGKIIKLRTHGRITFWQNHEPLDVSLGRLVLTAFKRPPVAGEVAVRLDTSGSFSLDNLKWAPHETAKLDPVEVRDIICRAHVMGACRRTFRVLGRRYGVHRETVRQIVRGERWQGVAG